MLNETTGQFSQVIKPLLKTFLELRTLRILTFGPNENTIIGSVVLKSSRVQMIDRIIARRKMSRQVMNEYTQKTPVLYPGQPVGNYVESNPNKFSLTPSRVHLTSDNLNFEAQI